MNFTCGYFLLSSSMKGAIICGMNEFKREWMSQKRDDLTRSTPSREEIHHNESFRTDFGVELALAEDLKYHAEELSLVQRENVMEYN